MMNKRDIVDDIFERIQEILGDKFAGEVVLKLQNEKQEIRQSWGGCEVYISKNNNRNNENRRTVVQGLSMGKSVRQISGESGISRASIYRLLRTKKVS